MTLLGIAWGSMTENPSKCSGISHAFSISLIRLEITGLTKFVWKSPTRIQHSYVIDISPKGFLEMSMDSWIRVKYEVGVCARFSILACKLSLRVLSTLGMSHQFNCAACRNVWRELVNWLRGKGHIGWWSFIAQLINL